MTERQRPAPVRQGENPVCENTKTLAELEAEARERAQAQRQASTPANDVQPHQPEINSLKKRGGNRLMMLGILLLAALILVAWMGDWVYNHFLKGPSPQTAPTKTVADEVSYGRKRQGMGMAENPLGLPDHTSSEPPTPEPQTAPPVVAFNKSLALATISKPQNSGQTATVSRTAERSLPKGSGISPTTAQPYTPCPVMLVMDASGKLTCPVGAQAAPTAPQVSTVSGVQRIRLDPDLSLPVDTYIPCTLQTRFVSDVAGRISCLIAEDVYSESTHVRLIPAGTRARGIYKTGTLNHGQARMFVMWTELRTPNRLKIPLVDSQVVGPLGEAGIDGWIDTHFWERFGNAMMLSTVQDVAAAATSATPSTDRHTDYTENSRTAAAEMAKTALDNSINIPPTIYKNQGDIIGIITGSDIDFSGVYRLKLKQGEHDGRQSYFTPPA
ncbi:VirB10/TraB/TrbI family type IV secretion system protein [Citrobacter sp. JGM124]|uniref:VirB10/TraB/TrbI family type IV secretion system protein n=1 Tax=Citrobacter sp. JGM124 TaxID=2799789 RepID=UPI001BAE390D|nr:VirB10/TraB/TrbI family type IV secretion system protein [Citrobacter sp. JGM124]MBS0847036.1 TrbI/VirB10 family protein [Citrobacter sp. JGM124]